MAGSAVVRVAESSSSHMDAIIWVGPPFLLSAFHLLPISMSRYTWLTRPGTVCLCRAQFCYECGETWKTCTCPQWRERLLLARANDVVDRDVGGEELAPALRARLVARQRRNLVVNHRCGHAVWRSLSGAHRCDECRDVLPEYIYECTRCRILACRTCRFNRLARA